MPMRRRDLLSGGLGAALYLPFSRASARPLAGEPLPSHVADVCVIGSGFAAAYLALQLADAGQRVTVLEAGDAQVRSGDAGFDCEKDGAIDYPVNRARAIGLGGTSALWAGVTCRLRADDFQLRSRYGMDTDWPLGLEELRPWYERAEALLGVGPAAPMPAPALLDVPETTQFDALQRAWENGQPLRLATHVIPRLQRHPRVQLLSSCRVARLHVDATGRIRHAESAAGPAAPLRIPARRFVLAAGVVETPRILLHSRAPLAPTGIGNRHDQVGRYFNAHPNLATHFLLQQPVVLPAAMQRNYDSVHPARQRGLGAFHLQLDQHPPGLLILKAQVEIEPTPENRVTLGERLDRDGLPAARLSFRFSERDRRTLEVAATTLSQTHAKLRVASRVQRRVHNWRHHPAGTCRMGFDATTGVVDRNLQVFGTRNLYVSGASVFPTSGTGNPTLTIIALSLRLADHLAQTRA